MEGVVKRQEVGELCCKIAGIYTLIAAISITLSALLSFISIREAMRHDVGMFASVIVFVPAVLLFCLSACFWRYSGNIAHRIFPQHDEELGGSSPSLTPAIIQRIALMLAGILILNGAISAMGNPIAGLLVQPRQMTAYDKVYLAEAVIRIAIGTWLLMGTERLRSLTKKDW